MADGSGSQGKGQMGVARLDYTNSTFGCAVSYDLSELVHRAKSGSFPNPDYVASPSASTFASWVFMLSHPESIKGGPSEQNTFEKAKRQEIVVESLMAGFNGIKLASGVFRGSGWELLYVDPLEKVQSSNWFAASRLVVGRETLHCRPDVVFLNRSSKELLIVERKVAVTSAPSIPLNCYPNVLAQLWCYSHIDFASTGWDLPKGFTVLLGAELWSHSKFESSDDGRMRYWLWSRSNSLFKQIRQLFELSGGVIQPTVASDAT